MNKIKLVIFDIDGTLLDTSEFIYQAYEHTIVKHGHPGRTRAEIATQIGKKIEECYAFLAPGGDVAKLMSDHWQFQRDNVGLIKPFAHVHNVLQTVSDRGITLALWTGREAYVAESLKFAGIDTSILKIIIEPRHTKHGKPHPEGILKILNHLSMQPQNTVMVGDSLYDIQAGRAASVAKTIGITHGFGTRVELEEAGADLIIDSIDELPELL